MTSPSKRDGLTHNIIFDPPAGVDEKRKPRSNTLDARRAHSHRLRLNAHDDDDDDDADADEGDADEQTHSLTDSLTLLPPSSPGSIRPSEPVRLGLDVVDTSLLIHRPSLVRVVGHVHRPAESLARTRYSASGFIRARLNTHRARVAPRYAS